MIETIQDILLSATPLVVVGVSFVALFSTLVIFRTAATLLRDPDKRLAGLDHMEYGLKAHKTGRLPKEGAAPEIARCYGPSGYYDGEGIVFYGQKTIAGRIL